MYFFSCSQTAVLGNFQQSHSTSDIFDIFFSAFLYFDIFYVQYFFSTFYPFDSLTLRRFDFRPHTTLPSDHSFYVKRSLTIGLLESILVDSQWGCFNRSFLVDVRFKRVFVVTLLKQKQKFKKQWFSNDINSVCGSEVETGEVIGAGQRKGSTGWGDAG